VDISSPDAQWMDQHGRIIDGGTWAASKYTAAGSIGDVEPRWVSVQNLRQARI